MYVFASVYKLPLANAFTRALYMYLASDLYRTCTCTCSVVGVS